MKLTPRQREEIASAAILHSLALILACSTLFFVTAYAADPVWWSSPGTGTQGAVVAPQVVTNSGVVTTNYIPNNNAVVTESQLKQFTARAVDELNATLTSSGGAGTTLNTMVSNWASDYTTNGYSATHIKPSDLSAMTVGQLKTIANLIYPQLAAGGYTGLAPSWLAANPTTDNTVATLGQLKEVFNFDLSLPPNAVTGLTVTASNPDELDLNWSLPAMNNATSIVLEQSTDGGTTWTTIATLAPTTTGYADTGLISTSGYEFKVVSSNTSGSSSPVSSGSPSSPLPAVPPPPTGLIATIASDLSGDMNLSWNSAREAASYNILREDLSTGVWSIIQTNVMGTSYTDSSYEGDGNHYEVVAVNSAGNSMPSNEYPLSRYAVIDLGPNVNPLKVTKSGYILLQTTDGDGNVTGYERWYNGVPTPLLSGTSPFVQPTNSSSPPWVPSDWASNSGNHINIWNSSAQTFVAADITELGWVLGAQDSENIAYYDYNSVAYPSIKSGYVCRAQWPPTSNTPSVLLNPNAEVWDAGINQAEFYGYDYGPNGTGLAAVGFDGTGTSPNAYTVVDDPFGELYLNDTDQGISRVDLTACNSSGDLLSSVSGTMEFNSTVLPSIFFAASLSNHVQITSGSTPSAVVVGTQSLSGTYTPAWWWAGTTYALPIQGGADYVNAATGTLTISGTLTTKPAIQILGWATSNEGDTLWEMDPNSTSTPPQFEPPLQVNDLLPPLSGWINVSTLYINDNGYIVGTATKTSDGTTHGILLVPAYQIQVDAFIPQQWVSDPVGYVYNGNSRKTPLDGLFTSGTATFTKTSPEYKIEQQVMATVLNNVDPGGTQEANSLTTAIGQTRKYYSSAVVSGLLSPTATPFATQTATPSISTVTITHPSSQVVTVELVGEASNPLANPLAPEIETPNPAWLGPIYYDITVKIDATTTPPTYTLSGNHKNFPAYEVYINRQLVHDYSPISGGYTPAVLPTETTGPSLSDTTITGGCATAPGLTGTITNTP